MKMKRTVLYIAALVAFPAISSAQLYVEPEQNVDCSVFIEKERGENAQQGLEIWDRYVFALEDGGHVRVFDFRTASGERLRNSIWPQPDLTTTRTMPASASRQLRAAPSRCSM